MEDRVDKAIQNEKEGTMADATSENSDELRKDLPESSDNNEYEIAMRGSQPDCFVASATRTS